MKILKSGAAAICVAAFFLFGLPVRSSAQENKVDIQQLTHETQQSTHKEHELTLVWWIPEDFWRASFAGNAQITDKQVEDFVKVVRPYVLVAVVEGQFGPFGGVTYETEKNVRDHLSLIDSEGKSYKPLDNADISSDLQNFLGMMKPVLVNMLGPMGKNFNFYAFPARGKNGKLIASAKEDGSFTIQSGEEKYKWRLPLGSLLPPKTCSKCGEKLSGAFKFCPYDGTALVK